MEWHERNGGYVSLSSPTVVEVPEDELSWGRLPGQWRGSELRELRISVSDRDVAGNAAYGNGVPSSPRIRTERNTGVLCPTVETTAGTTVAAMPDPAAGRDPTAEGHENSVLAMGTMDRSGRLTPKVYEPRLGTGTSRLDAGGSVTASFRITLRDAGWHDVQTHALNDVFGLGDVLDRYAVDDEMSRIRGRLDALGSFVTDPAASKWRTEEYDGIEVGAYDYAGYVSGGGQPMKNSDHGAMWLYAEMTDSVEVVSNRLPYVRNFKLAQILLFEPDDDEVRDQLRRSADKLLEWQREDGSWQFSYDRANPPDPFDDHEGFEDFRPTWVGLLEAYNVLGDLGYLDGAVAGAEWMVENGIEPGFYYGGTSDQGFTFDLGVLDHADGLLDLAEVTGEQRYREAAVEVGREYVGSVMTHPTPRPPPTGGERSSACKKNSRSPRGRRAARSC